MNDVQRKINMLLRDEGFHIVRSNRHFVWSDGQVTITTAASTSCSRAYQNIKAKLRRARLKNQGRPHVHENRSG